MEYKNFNLGRKKNNEIDSYLFKNQNKKKDMAWLGNCEISSSVPSYKYYIYKNLGLIIHDENLGVYGKSKKLIDKKISKLIKLSEGY